MALRKAGGRVNRLPLLALISVLFSVLLFPPPGPGEAIGGVEVVLYFYEPEVYVNATSQDPRVAVLHGFVRVTRSSTVIQDVEVYLEGSADGRSVTITPSTMTFSYGGPERQNFTLSFHVPDVLSDPWESITVHAGGTWRLVPGVDSGEISGSNATVMPAPTAYVRAKLLKEKVTGGVGERLEVPLFLENVGDTSLQVTLEVLNENDLGRESISLEYPRAPITVLPHTNLTVSLEVVKSHGAGGKYTLDISLKPYTAFGGTPDNVRRVVIPTRLNATVRFTTSLGGVLKSPLIILGAVVIIPVVIVALVIRKRRSTPPASF